MKTMLTNWLGLCLALLAASGCLKSVDPYETGKYTCSTSDDCAEGYVCATVGTRNVCVKGTTPGSDALDATSTDTQPQPDTQSVDQSLADAGDVTPDQLLSDAVDMPSPSDVVDVSTADATPDQQSPDVAPDVVNPCSGPLTFAPKLDTAIRQALNPTGPPLTGNITQASFTSPSLLLANRQIDDLTGIICLPSNVTTLDLSFNQLVTVQQLEPLKTLTSLKILRLRGNNRLVDGKRELLRGVGAVNQLTTLEELDLSLSEVNDLQPLKSMGLKRLLVSWKVSDADPDWVKDVAEERVVFLNDLKGVSEMTNLEQLDIYDQRVSDASALKSNGGMDKLKSLILGKNRLTTIDLSCCKALSDLDLSYQPVADLNSINYGPNQYVMLSSLNVSGTRIGNFAFLEWIASSLRVFRADDTGFVAVVGTFSNLTELEVLSLNRAQALPSDSLKENTKLKELYLSKSNLNDFCTLFKVNSLPPLQRLDLSENDTMSTGLFCLSTAPLVYLNLKNCKLSGAFLTLVQDLSTTIQELYLDGNDVEVLSSIFGTKTYPMLRRLGLSNSNPKDIRSTEADHLTAARFPALEWLDLANNAVEMPTTLNGLTTLKYLDLSYNIDTIGFRDLSRIGGLVNLEELNLRGNKIDTNRSSIQALTKLRVLTLADTECANNVNDPGGKALIAYLSPQQHTMLRKLDASACNVMSLAPFIGLAGLEFLDLSGNTGGGNAVDLSPLDTATMANLRTLRMEFLPLVDLKRIASAATNGRLPALTRLYLGNSNVSDETGQTAPEGSISHILASPLASRLRVLWLELNRITNLQGFSSLTAIRRLSLSSNFNGTGLSDISQLTTLSTLVALEVNANQISQIPSLFTPANLPSLRRLSIAQNPLTTVDAQLTTTFANWPKLESLDLSYLEVTSVSFVSGLPLLRSLNLHSSTVGGGVTDLSPLLGLKYLEQLNLFNNSACSDAGQASNRDALMSNKVNVVCNF